MYCPQCHVDNNHVIDSRFSEKMNSARRRRECDNCGFRFTTYEIASTDFDKIKDVIREDLKESFVRVLKKRLLFAIDYNIDITDMTSETYREINDNDAQ